MSGKLTKVNATTHKWTRRSRKACDHWDLHDPQKLRKLRPTNRPDENGVQRSIRVLKPTIFMFRQADQTAG